MPIGELRRTALVERARAGDAAAFSELVERYERKIYRLAKHITQNDEDAEDVLQESFLKAYTHLDSFQGRFEILHLDGPDCRERSAHEASEAQVRQNRVA